MMKELAANDTAPERSQVRRKEEMMIQHWEPYALDNAFYITMSGGVYGIYGKGDTLEEARRNWRKAGGRNKDDGYREFQFTSTLPFAPFDRDAQENEADAWVAKDGSLNWIRCTRRTLVEPLDN